MQIKGICTGNFGWFRKWALVHITGRYGLGSGKFIFFRHQHILKLWPILGSCVRKANSVKRTLEAKKIPTPRRERGVGNYTMRKLKRKYITDIFSKKIIFTQRLLLSIKRPSFFRKRLLWKKTGLNRGHLDQRTRLTREKLLHTKN